MTKTKACQTCGKTFTYEVGRGRDRKHCCDDCRAQYKKLLQERRLKSLPRCSVVGCNSPAVRVGAGLCEKHYTRMRRTGTLDARKVVGRYVTGSGYIKVLRRGHPMADANGHAFEHRVVAFEDAGGVCPSCFWCGCDLDWGSAVVDHLNENKQDNRPDNLVVSCNDCNRARGALLPFVARMNTDALDVFMERVREYHAKTARGE